MVKRRKKCEIKTELRLDLAVKIAIKLFTYLGFDSDFDSIAQERSKIGSLKVKITVRIWG
jgi:hypothetical protein